MEYSDIEILLKLTEELLDLGADGGLFLFYQFIYLINHFIVHAAIELNEKH